MSKVKTQINCPNCRQIIVAEIESLFDAVVDPSAKTRLLSGQFNLTKCPHCGFNGTIATPLVYHDPAKELLLTFVPTELAMPRDEQERAIGKIINQVTESLPKEQRKGYLFSPQTVLTLQGLVERILQEDGISKEMIEAQQKRVDLIQQLVSIEDDKSLKKLAKEEDEQIDHEFYSLLTQMIQLSAARGDEDGARQLDELQQKLLPITTIGKEIQARTKEVEEAVKTLRESGEELTREKLLEFVIEAPNEDRVDAYASLARPGMDYEFFQKLTERIDQKEGDEKQRLTDLREHLLDATRQIDEQIQARLTLAAKNVNILVKAEDIRTATLKNLAAVDEFFLEALNTEMKAAEKAKDEDKLAKLKQIMDTIQEAAQAVTVPVEFIQELIDADEEARKKIMEERAEEITPQLIEALTGILVQLDGPDNVEKADRVRAVYRDAVRISMQASLKKETGKE